MTDSDIYTRISDELQNLPRGIFELGAIENNLEYMRNLAASDIPEKLVRRVLSDEDLMNTISARSYHHVNHFDKIVLIDSGDPSGYRLTLHYWPGNYDDRILSQELVHDHRFSFWSHIFRGKLHTENFRVSDTDSNDNVKLRRYIYRPSKTGNIHTCDFDAEVSLEQLDDIIHNHGQSYFLRYDSTHRVVLPNEGERICTFVLRGPRHREFTYTYNTFYPARGTESSVPMMSTDMLRAKLNEILSAN